MRICRDCGCEEDINHKFKKKGNICGKCFYKRYKLLHKNRWNYRYKNDPNFREKQKEKCRRVRKFRVENGKEREYTESTPRRWMYDRSRRMMTHARRSGYICKVNTDFLEQLWFKQNGKCALTGIPMSTKHFSLFSGSVDRIDQSIGYIDGNIQLVCKFINLGKNSHSNIEAIEFIEAIRMCGGK